MVKILYGNEPYLIEQVKQQFKSQIQNQDMNYSVFDSYSSDVLRTLETVPFFEEYRMAYVSVTELSGLGNAFLKDIENIPDHAILIIHVLDVDTRQSLYHSLCKTQLLQKCDKISCSEVSSFVLNEAKNNGAVFEKDALSLFLEYENYSDAKDVSLFTLADDVKKLASYSATITVSSVRIIIKPNVSRKVFELYKMLKRKDIIRLREQADICSDKVIGTLCALLRELRMAYKSKYFSPSDIGVKYVALKDMPKKDIVKSIDITMSVIDGIKDGSIPESDALFYAFTKIMAVI